MWFCFNREKLLFAKAGRGGGGRTRGKAKAPAPSMTERLLERVLSRWDTKKRGELSRGDMEAALKERVLGLDLMPWELDVLLSKAQSKSEAGGSKGRRGRNEGQGDDDEGQGDDNGNETLLTRGSERRISIPAFLGIVREIQSLARADAEANALLSQQWGLTSDRF